MEGVFKTSSHVPLHIGGIPDPKTEKFYLSIDIPDGLSLLARYDANAVIRGLDAYPPQDRPNPIPIHLAFDGMVGSAFFALFMLAVFWILYFRRKRVVPVHRWLLRGIVLSALLSFLSVELGWIVTEEGRQPWVIYGYLYTRNAVTTAPLLDVSFLVFSIIYVVLAVTMIVLLLRLARQPLPEMAWATVASGPQTRNKQPNQKLKVGS
jgi:cytochrome d ubiquinol oxidase subunit I